MSRLLIAASLVAVFTSFAAADRVSEPRFAQPPPSAGASARIEAEPIVLDRAKVRAKLAANRAANLARFRAYQRAGVFPSNTYSDSKLNVWLDADGHLCAAATIIKASGQADLVARVADQTNFIRLADVTQGPLMDWILTSGLTQAEIVAIQEPFAPVVSPVEPSPRIVDGDLRRRENQRLLAKYKSVDATIVKGTQASLDVATDRLMKHPELALKLLAS